MLPLDGKIPGKELSSPQERLGIGGPLGGVIDPRVKIAAERDGDAAALSRVSIVSDRLDEA